MSSRIFAGPEAHGASSATKPQSTTLVELYPELVRGLHQGVVFLKLENPSDIKTLRIVDINLAGAEMLGSTPQVLSGKTLADFPLLQRTEFPDLCRAALRHGRVTDFAELPYGNGRTPEGIYSGSVFPLSNNFLGIVFENVTSRHLAELALRESEERFRLLIEGVQEYAIFQLDPSGRVMSWNAGAERLKGYSSEEITAKHFSAFYLPEDIQSGRPDRNLRVAAQKGQCEDEGWRVRKDGSLFWANVVITALRDAHGNLLGFAKLTRDMTELREQMEGLRKAKAELEVRVEQRTAVLTRINNELRTEIAERRHVEDQLRTSLDQLRALAARLQGVREEERTHVAREIHDELGQACTAIKMDLALIGNSIRKTRTPLRSKISSAMQLVDSMIQMLRRIASDLRPRALDDLGLPAALEWQAQEFENRTGIRCRVVLPEDMTPIDPERSTAVFRIFQESLTNVARHAQATRVEARLNREENQLVFQVRDNGKGFDPEEAARGKSLGLVGMQERALLVNGELKIEGTPGVGTTMTLRIPLPSIESRIHPRNEASDR